MTLPIQLERKVVAGSVSALFIGGMSGWLVPFLRTKGLPVDTQMVDGLLTGGVTGGVTLLAAYLARHTHRPELAGQVDAALGVDDTRPAGTAAHPVVAAGVHPADQPAHSAVSVGSTFTVPNPGVWTTSTTGMPAHQNESPGDQVPADVYPFATDADAAAAFAALTPSNQTSQGT